VSNSFKEKAMNISNYGKITKDDIAGIIAKKMGVNEKAIAFKYVSDNDIRTSFDIDTNNDFGVVETFTYNYEELLEISKSFLKDKGFDVFKFETLTHHTPGCVYEPLDYGNTDFIGFKFYFEAKDPA